jgi:hypothetical protein
LPCLTPSSIPPTAEWKATCASVWCILARTVRHAAENLAVVFDKYGNIGRQACRQELGSSVNILQDLRARPTHWPRCSTCARVKTRSRPTSMSSTYAEPLKCR